MEEEKKTIKAAEVEEEQAGSKKKQEYLYAVGKRKTAVAQVRVYKKGDGKFLVNDKDVTKYFPSAELLERVKSPLVLAGQIDKLDITVKTKGGGIAGQADAVRHGISRALLMLNPNFRKPLKKAGFLTRDARIKERKKPGLKRARKAPQWTKR
ncbi:MAG: 30S ribosomal protein S9 [Parcubacteria group bacterium GW2011_GWC2_39_14]|nr:MAG: 30S ribosomal protein S9 [Parcubacteria group bacterium GW2011_GWC2_39_14]KKR53299.1 MAG: 30S ribosomal protein S9 [Parcubacteria group bacterium GW2011_GWA2_40_23]